MKYLLQGGRVLDPGRNLDDSLDVLIEGRHIVDLVPPDSVGSWSDDATVIDARDLIIAPGLIDMHVHLREPGHEYKETIATGTAAAAAGGFTAVAAMPNTHPVNDERSVTEFIIQKAAAAGMARVWPIAAMTLGSRGEDLAEFGDLADAGAVGVSDDGRWVKNGQTMRRVMEYAKVFNLAVISHAEDPDLSAGGVMNEGRVATRLGLAGIPATSEISAVFRDIQLSKLCQCPVHIAHVSTAGAVEVIRRAKAEGIHVTAETAPHYFSLTEDAVVGYRTEAKMNPPLRSWEDVQSVRAGLADGTIDVIATDHAPHSILEKNVEFDMAAFGIVGLETAVPLVLEMVREGVLSLSRAIASMTVLPANILGLDFGTLRPGGPADISVLDMKRQFIVDSSKFISKGRNTPFENRKMTGMAVLTFLEGRITHNIL